MNNNEPDTLPSAKSGQWDWLWSGCISAIMAIIAVRLFGPIGGLITVGSYYFLEPKLGLWRALVASGVIGLAISYVVGVFILR